MWPLNTAREEEHPEAVVPNSTTWRVTSLPARAVISSRGRAASDSRSRSGSRTTARGSANVVSARPAVPDARSRADPAAGWTSDPWASARLPQPWQNTTSPASLSTTTLSSAGSSYTASTRNPSRPSSASASPISSGIVGGSHHLGLHTPMMAAPRPFALLRPPYAATPHFIAKRRLCRLRHNHLFETLNSDRLRSASSHPAVFADDWACGSRGSSGQSSQ